MTAMFPTNQDLAEGQLRRVFGTFPTGVVAVAAEVGGVLTGLAASSFSTISLEPALVSFSIATTSRTWPELRRADHVGVTILADHHGDLARQLAGPVEQRFTKVPLRVTEQGAVMIDGGVSHFDTTIYREVEAGDHTIVLLQLHAANEVEDGLSTRPLLFHRSGFGRLG